MPAKTVSINRAPVLTLWAALVAQRLGFDEDDSLTLGKALAGLNAQTKGRSLGIFKPHEEKPKKAPPSRQEGLGCQGRPGPRFDREADARRRDQAQAAYVEDFFGAVLSFLAFHVNYAELPNEWHGQSPNTPRQSGAAPWLGPSASRSNNGHRLRVDGDSQDQGNAGSAV